MSMSDPPSRAIPPPAVPDADWTPIDPFPFDATENSFVSGGPAGARLRIAYFRRATDGRLVGRAWFGPETVGPPGHAHGGSMAAVLDEALGAAAWADGYPILVARLAVDFRQLLPLGTDATFETWVEAVDGRKVTTRGRLLLPDGSVVAEGEALCVMLAKGHIDKLQAVRAT